jgi:WD40 repeat protein
MSFSAAATETEKTLAIRPCQKFHGHTDWVRGVIHLPGGQRIMTCSFDGSLRVWNLKTGEQIVDAWRDGEGGVLAIALSLDGKKVVCGCVDGAVKLWDINTGKIIAKWTGHTYFVRSVCWNRDCGRVLSASGDGTATVWDVESGKTVLAIETVLSDFQAVIYSPDMTMIATGGGNREKKEFIKIWDAKTGKLITNLKGHTEEVYCLAWTADRTTLISGSNDFSIT